MKNKIVFGNANSELKAHFFSFLGSLTFYRQCNTSYTIGVVTCASKHTSDHTQPHNQLKWALKQPSAFKFSEFM